MEPVGEMEIIFVEPLPVTFEIVFQFVEPKVALPCKA